MSPPAFDIPRLNLATLVLDLQQGSAIITGEDGRGIEGSKGASRVVEEPIDRRAHLVGTSSPSSGLADRQGIASTSASRAASLLPNVAASRAFNSKASTSKEVFSRAWRGPRPTPTQPSQRSNRRHRNDKPRSTFSLRIPQPSHRLLVRVGGVRCSRCASLRWPMARWATARLVRRTARPKRL